jgi:hypothetical protein
VADRELFNQMVDSPVFWSLPGKARILAALNLLQRPACCLSRGTEVDCGVSSERDAHRLSTQAREKKE